MKLTDSVRLSVIGYSVLLYNCYGTSGRDTTMIDEARSGYRRIRNAPMASVLLWLALAVGFICGLGFGWQHPISKGTSNKRWAHSSDSKQQFNQDEDMLGERVT